MSRTSSWPLSPAARRILTPGFLLDELRHHPLTAGCYPTAMGYYPRAIGHHMERSKPDDNLLLFCTEGRGEVNAGGNAFTLSGGQTLLIPAGQAHAYAAAADDPWTLYWVHFLGLEARDFVHHLVGDASSRLHTGVDPSLLSAFEQMLAVDTTGYSLNAFVAAANRLRYLLAECALCRDRQRRYSKGRINLDALQTFMRERISDSLTLEELAAIAGLTPQHFASRYKAETGYSPVRHFLNMKMEAACKLLDSSDYSVKQVAAQLGYDDPLYFSRRFRRTVGLSPTQYRVSSRR